MTGPAALPDWVRPLADLRADHLPRRLWRFPVPPEGGRQSAVLILASPGPELLLIERAATMRSHAGQPAFPGGAVDPDDDGPVGAALREAEEETGLDPAAVRVLATLPPLWLPPSGFVVTPVLAWQDTATPVSVVDEAEVGSVHRVPVSVLADPAHRFLTGHPNGWTGPAFSVPVPGRDLLVWGFTAGLLDGLLEAVGWARPWDRTRHRALPPEVIRLARRGIGSDTLPEDLLVPPVGGPS